MDTRRVSSAAEEPQLYHIGDVASLTGLTEHALRAWERVDLLAPRRTATGVRQYTADDIARIRLIIRTLDVRKLSRRAVASLLRSGELRPDAADYAHDAALAPYRHAQARGETARPDDSTGRLQRLLASVARVMGAVASGRPRDEVLAAICRETCEAFAVSDAVLWLLEGDETEAAQAEAEAREGSARMLVASAAYGSHSRAALNSSQPLRIALDDRRAVVARAMRTRRGIIVNALAAAPDAHPELRSLLPGAALLVAPLLRSDGEPVGALALREALEQERFDAGDLERARLFATQAAIAIETARLHARMRAAQQEIEEERARWRATVENMPELVLTCDTSTRLTFVNAAFERLSGRGADPTVPLAAGAQYYGLYRPDGSDIYPPENLPLARTLSENRPIRDVELRQRTADDGQRLIAWDAAPVRGADGELLGAVAVGHDITEERRRSERERCLTAVTRAAGIAHVAEGSSRVAQALRALVEQSEVAMIAATLYTYDDERGALQRAGSYGVETTLTVPPVVPLSTRHSWWEPVTQGALYSSPGGSLPRWLMGASPTVWRHSSRRAWATVPLRAGGTFLGVLAVGLATPHVWDEAEREWFEACAGAVAMALANDRLYAAAQRRAAELEAVLDAVDVGITMVSADGRMRVRNAAAVALTGREEYTGTMAQNAWMYELRDAVTGEPVPAEESPVARALQGELVRETLLVMRDGMGQDRIMQASSVPVCNASGQVVAAVSVFREVETNGTSYTSKPRRAGEPFAENVVR